MTWPDGRRAVSRRDVLGAPALLGLLPKSNRPLVGGFVNDSHARGHALRDRRALAPVRRTTKVPVVIVGGGVAGLCAAWRLQKRGFRDFVLLEMEAESGGNSRWGSNEVTRFPWGAHYVPVPDRRSALVWELFEEFGLLRDGQPEERHLCFSPQERLFLHGRWQEGLEPEVGTRTRDHEQYRRFAALIDEQRQTGQYTIPSSLGARPSPLDRLSMADWLRGNRLDSGYLRWHVEYACRDDYGCSLEQTSAWAGVHYFASRPVQSEGPFTWPEGNGWLVSRLLARVGSAVRANAPVQRIRRVGQRFMVYLADEAIACEAVIFAAPTFLAPYLVEGVAASSELTYSPWLTANLTLDRVPASSGEYAWDNVLFASPSLGYVVATHMGLQSQTPRTVWTYYRPLWEMPPEQGRRLLLQRPWGQWATEIVTELERVHPDLRRCLARIDLMRFGHAMVRPTPGLQDRRESLRKSGVAGFYFAHSDGSGLSLFEEAQSAGVEAADQCLRRVGKHG